LLPNVILQTKTGPRLQMPQPPRQQRRL